MYMEGAWETSNKHVRPGREALESGRWLFTSFLRIKFTFVVVGFAVVVKRNTKTTMLTSKTKTKKEKTLFTSFLRIKFSFVVVKRNTKTTMLSREKMQSLFRSFLTIKFSFVVVFVKRNTKTTNVNIAGEGRKNAPSIHKFPED